MLPKTQPPPQLPGQPQLELLTDYQVQVRDKVLRLIIWIPTVTSQRTHLSFKKNTLSVHQVQLSVRRLQVPLSPEIFREGGERGKVELEIERGSDKVRSSCMGQGLLVQGSQGFRGRAAGQGVEAAASRERQRVPLTVFYYKLIGIHFKNTQPLYSGYKRITPMQTIPPYTTQQTSPPPRQAGLLYSLPFKQD